MRTTLTLDDDVAIELKQMCGQRGVRFKHVVNQALRAGLRALQETPDDGDGEPYRTSPVSLGRPTYPDLDNVAELLAVAEGDEHR
jgi:hypothetical protein